MIALIKKKRMVGLMILCSILLLLLAGCGKFEKGSITSYDQLEQPGIKIAVALDSPQESSLAQDYPKAELIPYPDMFLAYKDVASGKIDACVHARKEMELAIQNGTSGVRLLKENYASDIIAVGISPVSGIPDLQEKLNAFIAEKKADGTLDDMYNRWVVLEDDTMPDITQAENPSFTLCVGTTGTVMPYSYYKGTELAGYDIELAHRFAAWLGAGLEFKVYDFGGIIAAAQAGNIDCIMSNLFYTPEKDESIPFSDPLFEVDITAMVRDTTQSAQSATTAAYTSVDQLNGKNIGSATGTTYDDIVRRRLPDVTFSYYNTYSDMVAAMQSGKIAAFACDEPVLRTIMAENSQVTMIPEYLDTFEFGFTFPKSEKGSALCGQMSEFIREIRESGELSQMEDKWVNGHLDDADMPNAEDLGGENGILTLAINALNAPFDFMRGNEYAGYEVELVVRFCKRYGYGLAIKNMDFDAVLASVQTDKADFGAATISITEERKQSVLFSDPHFSGGTVLAVLKVQEGAASAAGAASKTPQYQSFSDLSRKRVSMLTGAPFEELIRSRVPDVGEFSYYSTMADMLQALRSEKTDAILLNNAVSQLAVNRNPDFAQFPQSLQDSVFGMAFAKGDPRRDTWQAAFDSIPKETIQAAWEKWTGADERLKVLPEQDWPGRNGTIQVAACDTLEPMSYAGEGGELRGFDPELVLMMARELDVHVELVGMELSAVLSYVQSGKALIGVGSIIATDERRESVDFIDYYPAAFVLVVRAAGESAERTSFLDGVKSSFYKTFIRENRWQLFVKGVVTTLVITLFSILFPWREAARAAPPSMSVPSPCQP